MKFDVIIPVKPYVKRFLENNYGAPVDFHSHPRENDLFLRMLKKPCYLKDHMYQPDLGKYTSFVTVKISERSFYRHGWELSKTDIIAFGKHFERNAKMLMRSIVGIYISFGIPTNTAISKFQIRFKMEEEYWPYDSIIKDFSRYKNINEIDFNHHAYQHIEELILLNMSNAGILSKSLIHELEKTMVEC